MVANDYHILALAELMDMVQNGYFCYYSWKKIAFDKKYEMKKNQKSIIVLFKKGHFFKEFFVGDFYKNKSIILFLNEHRLNLK